MMKKLGIIGAGVMGQAILNSITKKSYLTKDKIGIFDTSDEKLITLNLDGYKTYNSASELVSDCEFILISVKPQHFNDLSDSIKLHQYNTIISIMAGVKTETIKSRLGKDTPIARVMPNTPCQIGKGVCAVCFKDISDEQKLFIKGLLMCCGEVVDVEERYFDAVTSVSGSGPAYVYMFIDGMIEGGIIGGLSYEQSKILAINTVIGAAQLALESEEEPEKLTEKVCSKGGTTIEAVKIYQERGLKKLICDGIAACKKRSEEMSKT